MAGGMSLGFRNRFSGKTLPELRQGTRATGVKRIRKRLFLVRADIVAVARLEDVVDE